MDQSRRTLHRLIFKLFKTMRITSYFASLLVSCCIAGTASAQVLSPAEFLNYELGSRFTPHHRVVDYFQHVADESSIVALKEYGRTYEDRPLLVAVLSSTDNMSRIEEIRNDNLVRAGINEGPASGTKVPIVWLSYGVHGNESVSTEASMATLYELADPSSERSVAWLKDVVVILDPCLNPDGRSRYVSWFNQTTGKNPSVDPDAREHSEPWPGGRTNHYMFDLNRDWSWSTQKETRSRVTIYNEWLPQIHVDFHEQGINSPYYFAPAAEPFHENVTEWQRSFQKTMGDNHARYFDQNGWLYFTRERFDLLYPGYGDTWPIFHGAIGVTYEQAGGGGAGLAVRTATDDTLSLRDRIEHHHVAGLSTVEVTVQNKSAVIAEFEKYFADAVANPPGDYKSYVVASDNSPDKINKLRDFLDSQHIIYGRARDEQKISGYSYFDRQIRSHQVTSDDLVIPAAQPHATMVKVLFEPSTVVDDSITYDITAWSLPYVHGINTFAVDRVIRTADWTTSKEPTPVTLERPYAYLNEWADFDDARLLAALTRAGIKTRFSIIPFEIDGHAFPAGSIITLRSDNRSIRSFDETVLSASGSVGQPLPTGVASGMVQVGPDFGSSKVRYVKQPRVATVTGPGVSSSAFGEVWHYFDQQLDYPLTVFNVDEIASIDLHDVDVLILPNGSYGKTIDDEARKSLRDWVRRGGRLILMEGALRTFAGKEGFALKAIDEPKKDSTDVLKKFGDRQRESRMDATSGSIYEVALDNSHPLAFGYGDQYFALKRSTTSYKFDKNLWNVGTIMDDGYVSGFAGSTAREKLTNTLVMGVEEIGRGRVVYLVDDPLFRGFWENGKLLFANAVFRVGQ